MMCVDADPEPSPVAKEMHRSSFIMNLATIFMFGGPYVHAKRLKDITLDQIVNKDLLEKYTEKMVAEWRDVALYVGPILRPSRSILTQPFGIGHGTPWCQCILPGYPEC